VSEPYSQRARSVCVSLSAFFILNCSDAKNLLSNGTSWGSFTVEYESIRMGNVRIVYKVFLTMLTVKHMQ